MLAIELAEHLRVRLVEYVCEHVDATAMRHRDHDFTRAGLSGILDERVEHGHERIGSLDREPLHVHPRAANEPFEPVDGAEALERRTLLFGRQIAFEPFLLDGLAEPVALVSLAEVGELERDVRRVQVAQTFGHVRGGADVEPERQRGNELQVGLGDAVKFGSQLRGSWRRRPERVELHREVPVLSDRVDERCGASDFSKVDRVGGYRGGRRRSAADLFGEAKELAPGLVDRRRIATVRLEDFGDVAVVEHARDGGAGHVPNLTVPLEAGIPGRISKPGLGVDNDDAVASETAGSVRGWDRAVAPDRPERGERAREARCGLGLPPPRTDDCHTSTHT